MCKVYIFVLRCYYYDFYGDVGLNLRGGLSLDSIASLCNTCREKNPKISRSVRITHAGSASNKRQNLKKV